MPKTILLVDDQEVMIRVVQAALAKLGAHLPSARTGTAAVKYVAEVAVPDVIVLDYSMPDMDGVETLRQIRGLASGESIPVVMLTARDQTLIRSDAEGLKVSEFMTKPFSPAALEKSVKKLLERSL